MPAPSPSYILDDPPSVVPDDLLNFPYRLRVFPLDDLLNLPPAAEGSQPEASVVADAVE